MPSQVFAKLVKKEKLLDGLYKFSVEAKEVVDNAPKMIKEAVDKATAEAIKAKLEEIEG